MKKQKSQILFNQHKIEKRIAQLARQISRDFKHSSKELVLVCVLKGAVIFACDLARKISLPLTLDFLRVSSYSGQSSGKLRLDFDLTQPVSEKNVLLIEDIVDTGKTLTFLKKHLLAQKPASLKIAALLYKPIKPALKKEIDYIGFTIPNAFVVGYGMDSDGLFRNLPAIHRL